MSEGNYRLKQEVITDFMRQRMPTLCETEKPLKWWIGNKIVPNDEDLEPCEGKNVDASAEPSINYDGVLDAVNCEVCGTKISEQEREGGNCCDACWLRN